MSRSSPPVIVTAAPNSTPQRTSVVVPVSVQPLTFQSTDGSLGRNTMSPPSRRTVNAFGWDGDGFV